MKHPIFFLFIFFVSAPVVIGDIKTWKLIPTGYLNIERNDDNYGGFSGIEISNDGLEILMITDKSFFFKLNLLRDQNQNLKNFSIIRDGRLLSSKGEFLDKRNTDSESIVRDSNGFYFISFESNNRVMKHENIDGKAKFLEKHSDFKKLGSNKGIEALAIDKHNRLVAIPEKPPKGKSLLPIYRYEKDNWSLIKEIKINNDFLVTGAEFISDDKLLLLERKFSWTNGFKSRFRLLSLGFFGNTEPKIIFTSNPNQFDNLEGLAIWNDIKGNKRVITVSDDNFHPLQRSEIVEFILKFE